MNNVVKDIMRGDSYKTQDNMIIKYLNEIICGLKEILKVSNNLLNNQAVINNKLNYIHNNAQNITYRPIRFLTPRQLYMMVKDGYTLDEISLISGYDLKLVNEKIDSYIKNNT